MDPDDRYHQTRLEPGFALDPLLGGAIREHRLAALHRLGDQPALVDRITAPPCGTRLTAPQPVTYPPVRPAQHVDAGRVIGDQLGHPVEDAVETDIDVSRLGRQTICVDHHPHGAEGVVGHRGASRLHAQHLVDGIAGRV